jgi:hypothetical protein
MPGPIGAEIICTKCGAKAPAPGYACPRCQGALAKVCGHCKFQNAITKNYCDRCGTPLVLGSRPASPEPLPAPSAPAAGDIPQTVIRRSGPGPAPLGPPLKIVAPPPAGLSIPSADNMSSGGPTSVSEGGYVPPPPPTENSYTRIRRRDNINKMYFWAPLVIAAAAAYYFYYDYHKPAKEIPRAAAEYLDTLSRQDFEGAYALLSDESRAHCTLEEFRAFREDTPWTWSDAQLINLEPDAAIVKYRLMVKGKPPSDDYLMFLRQDGQWVRPYNWNLLRRAEDAFDTNNPDMALLLAQEAVRINPRDPMARGYLCEAVYYRKVPEETEKECALALQLSTVYPSKLSLSLKSLYHLRAILGDTYKNALRKYPEALAQYDALLAFPNLSQADQCDLLLARADTRITMGKAAEAAPDLQAAAAACVKPADLDYIRQRQAQIMSPRGSTP